MKAAVTDRERYLFDVQGFLVIKGVLTDAEVKRLNSAVDANSDRIEATGKSTWDSTTLAGDDRRQYTNLLSWERPWSDPFRELLADPRISPYLDELLGRGWHLDTEPVFFHYPTGAGGLKFHGGDPHFHSGAYYDYRNGEMRNGLIVVQFTLSDQTEGDGGFCCIPGSHKSNYVRPTSITKWESDQEIVRNPTLRAGDVLIFTEALTHGTLPWTASHDRRALHYRFSPKCVQYGPGVHSILLPTWADDLTEAQRAVLEPAFYYGRPLVGDDGSVARPMVDITDPPYRYTVPEDTQLPSVDPEADPESGKQGSLRVVPAHRRETT